MGKKAADQPPEKVIRWLRTPEGEQWSEHRISSELAVHADDSGVFADVIPDSLGEWARTAWPEPLSDYDLGSE
jgi:hypothetical protein